MTTANYSAHDAATTEILPIYFIANEWRINWMERLTQALQDASEAAAIGATLSNVQTVFQAIRCAINDAIDRLDDAAKQPDCYDVIKRMSSGLEVSMLQHVNMLNVMILNSRYDVDVDGDEEPEGWGMATDMMKCALGGMAGAGVSRRRWMQEHLKAMPF